MIQGDGINLASLSRILEAVLEAGYSAEVRVSKQDCAVPTSMRFFRCWVLLFSCLLHVLERFVLSQAVAFGMGGGLLQKVNRDTMSFATKLSHIVYADGTKADIMKSPTGDPSKISFPGDDPSPSMPCSVWNGGTWVSPHESVVMCIV